MTGIVSPRPIACTPSLLLAATALLLAQTPAGTGAAQVTFSAGTQEVLVDARVLDKKGDYQRDLTRQDFKLFEDGKEQKITSFSHESAQVPGRSSKHFVALVVEYEQPGLREQLVQFVDRFASPDLYIAVYSRVNGEMRLQQGFTQDAGRIKAAVRTMPAVPIANPLHFFARLSSVTKTLAPIRGPKALILFSYGILDLGLTEYGRGNASTPTDDGKRAAAPETADRPGAPGNPFTAQLHWAIDECNAAEVSVYAFTQEGGGGPTGHTQNRRMPAPDPHGGITDIIGDLAEYTGGSFTPPGTYDLASYLGSVSKEQSEYYRLGYTPSASAGDKPCHKLQVKVDRSGLKVNARESYCTSGQTAARALNSAQKALEARAVSGVAGNIAAGLQLSWFHAKPYASVVDIAMDIDPRAMKMHGKLHGEFELLGVAYREDGSVAARVPDTVKLDFDTPGQGEAFLKVPYHYSKQFEIAPGRYRFRMAVGSGDEAFGSVEKSLDIEPWSGHTMSVSGIALGARDYPLTGVTAEIANELLEGPRRLASRGRALVPLGGAEFHAGQKGMFYFEIYEPRLAQGAPGQPIKPPALRIRVLDRATGEEQADSGPMDAADWMQAGNPVIPIALTFPVASLPAGSYTLEVQVTREGELDAMARRADFAVK
jgi:VWFA-related protein